MSRIGFGLLRNDEYKGFFNCLRRIVSEEGPLSLYRGYTAYMLAIMFWMSFLPAATDFMMANSGFSPSPALKQNQSSNAFEDDEDDD